MKSSSSSSSLLKHPAGFGGGLAHCALSNSRSSSTCQNMIRTWSPLSRLSLGSNRSRGVRIRSRKFTHAGCSKVLKQPSRHLLRAAERRGPHAEIGGGYSKKGGPRADPLCLGRSKEYVQRSIIERNSGVNEAQRTPNCVKSRVRFLLKWPHPCVWTPVRGRAWRRAALQHGLAAKVWR